MTLEKAIDHLREEYDRALKNRTVYTPLAYALYHTWRYVDSRERQTAKKARKEAKGETA